MRYLASHEQLPRGTFDFPLALYEVDENHPRYTMPFHWHMEQELLLVRTGTFHLSVDGVEHHLSPGDGFLIGENAIHGGQPEGCRYVCVVFSMEQVLSGAAICRQQLTQLLRRGSTFIPAQSQAAMLSARICDTLAGTKPGHACLTTGYLWLLVGALLSLESSSPAPAPPEARHGLAVKQVLRRIRADYAAPLTLEQLAAEAALEPKYFCRVFRAMTGRSPIDYLIYYRVECAAELLSGTQQSITDVALSCGFSDASYFGRVFRRQKGMSPRAYRAQQQKQ